MNTDYWQKVEGHPNLRKDPDSGAVVNVDPHSTKKERKKAMREQSQQMEQRLTALESVVFEIRDMLREK